MITEFLITLVLSFSMTRCFSSTDSVSHHGSHCEKITIPMCQDIGYNFTSMPNRFNHDNQDEAGLEIHQFWPLVKINCSSDLRFFLCLLYVPSCEKDKVNMITPCRDVCERAKSGCAPLMQKFGFNWPERMECSNFHIYGQECISNPFEAKHLGTSEVNSNPDPDWNSVSSELNKIVDELKADQSKVFSPNTERGFKFQTESMIQKILQMEKKSSNLYFRLGGLEKDLKTLSKLNKTLIPPAPSNEKGCDPPFNETSTGCIWFHKLPSLNFEDARRFCQAYNGDLLEPTDLISIKEYMNDIVGYTWFYIWVGAKRSEMSKEKFFTISGKPIDLPPGEMFVPSNSKGGACMVLHGAKGYRPMSHDCKDTNFFICKKNI